MTVNATVAIAGPFTAPLATGPFNFSFKVFADSEVEVTRTSVLGVNSVLVLTADYTVVVSTLPTEGGVVTLGDALVSGEEITIRRSLPLTQLIDLVNQGPWDPTDHEEFADRVVMLAQRIQEELDRSYKQPIGSELSLDTSSDLYLQRPTLLAETIVPIGGPAVANIVCSASDGQDMTRYDYLLCEIVQYKLLGATTGKNMEMVFGTGTSFPGTGYLRAMFGHDSLSVARNEVGEGGVFFNLVPGGQADRGATVVSGTVLIQRDGRAAVGGGDIIRGFMKMTSGPIDSGALVCTLQGAVARIGATFAIDGFRVRTTAAAVESVGTLRLWGLPKT